MSKRICSIDGCGQNAWARGWCSAHYQRWRKRGCPLSGGTSPGALPQFIRDVALKHSSDECLIWPFACDANGYGRMNKGGNSQLAHRVVCELVHGPAPTKKHNAAHSCGRGDKGCVSPRHLSWKTPKENSADMVLHGTVVRGEAAFCSRLANQDVPLIVELIQNGETQASVARKFGVDPSAISHLIRGRTWAWLTNIVREPNATRAAGGRP